jgi:hypothetical protein
MADVMLAITHVENSDPPAFTLVRLSDAKATPQAVVRSPYEFPLAGEPNRKFMAELRWYFEDFLDYPFPPETERAERLRGTIESWGRQAFNALFDRRDAGRWLEQADVIQIRSDHPQILSWPWEALFDPQTGFLAHRLRIERRLNQLPDAPQMGKLPKERVNILLVTCGTAPLRARWWS